MRPSLDAVGASDPRPRYCFLAWPGGNPPGFLARPGGRPLGFFARPGGNPPGFLARPGGVDGGCGAGEGALDVDVDVEGAESRVAVGADCVAEVEVDATFATTPVLLPVGLPPPPELFACPCGAAGWWPLALAWWWAGFGAGRCEGTAARTGETGALGFVTGVVGTASVNGSAGAEAVMA